MSARNDTFRLGLFVGVFAVALGHGPALGSEATRSMVSLMAADNTAMERAIVKRFVAGERGDSAPLRHASERLRLLQLDLLTVGHAGTLPALHVDDAAEIPAAVVLFRAGIEKVDVWQVLTGAGPIVFKRRE